MQKIKVYFADGTEVIFHEEQSFQAITYFQEKDSNNKSASMSEIFSLWNHTHDGLLPSFYDILANSEYFFDIEKPSMHYNSNSIVKIMRL